MARWIVFLFLAAASLYSGTGLPDVWTEDIVNSMNGSEAEYIRLLRYETEDIPLQCMTGICPEKVTFDRLKGMLSWPVTQAGVRVHTRCPYSFDEERYAYYDCVLDDTLNATWADDVTMDNCPGPPLWEFIHEMIRNKSASESQIESRGEIIQIFDAIHHIVTKYPDSPVMVDDVEIPVVFDYVVRLLEDTETLNRKLLVTIMDVADYLIDRNFHFLMRDSMETITRMIHGFTALTRLPSGHVLLAPPTLKSPNNRLMLARKTLQVGMEEQILSSVDYNISAELPSDGSQEQEINVMLFDVALFVTMKGNVPPPTMLPMFDGNDVSDAWNHTVQPTDSEPDLNISSPSEAYSRSPLPLIQGTSQQASTFWKTINDYQFRRGILFVSALKTANDMSGNGVLFSHTRKAKQGKDMCFSTPYAEINTAALGADRAPLTTWYTSNDSTVCLLVASIGTRSTCQCQLHSGYLGMAYAMDSDGGGLDPAIDTLSEFLGFPYSAELYIVGHVLRALSLVCLTVTLLSHIGMRRKRRGRPTLILLHLCTSLTLLLILLYLAEGIAHTRTGCQVANVLRYYLVMVSLLWNAVEAYNMYLMLIKVFDQQTDGLVTKAALIAWGIPAVVIGIVFATNKKGFIGGYIRCEFKCFLPESTLYYGYLLPMSLIILHNLVIFSLVIRVLVNSAKVAKESLANQSHGKYWRQLSGAVAMLVLLGVPWLFSAFGAISHDASDAMKNTEAAFQIIFALFVNIQGIFIFLFHCARNVDLKREWKSALSTASSRLGSTRSRSDNSSLRMTNGSSNMTSTAGTDNANQN